MLDMQNKCLNGSFRGGSRTFAISKMEFFLTIGSVQILSIPQGLHLAGILHPCIVHVQLSLYSTIVYSSFVPFGIKYTFIGSYNAGPFSAGPYW